MPSLAASSRGYGFQSAYCSYSLYILFLGKMLESRRGYWLGAFFSGICLWACYQDLHLISKSRQEKLVVYCVPKKRFIDFFAGRMVTSLADHGKQAIAICRNDKPLRRRHAGRRTEYSWDSAVELPHLRVQKPFIQFFEKRIILLDDTRCLDTQASAYPADLLIVSHSPNVELRKALEVFPSKKVVFDASNSQKKSPPGNRNARHWALPFTMCGKKAPSNIHARWLSAVGQPVRCRLFARLALYKTCWPEVLCIKSYLCPMTDILSIARKTLQIEADALMALADSLDDSTDFEACVRAIAASPGRLVLTGIGKSAIVAQKISATLNSTGTPALFFMRLMPSTAIWA